MRPSQRIRQQYRSRCSLTVPSGKSEPLELIAEEPPSQQPEARSPVHLPLDRLQAVDLPVGLPVAVRQRERGCHGRLLALQAHREGFEALHATREGLLQPSL